MDATFRSFTRAETLQRGLPETELKAAAKDGRYEDEGWRVRKDGTQFWANVVITALRDQSGTLLGFAKMTRDLSDPETSGERRLQQRLAATLWNHQTMPLSARICRASSPVGTWARKEFLA